MLRAAVAEAREALGSAGEVQPGSGSAPRYELFHAASSICSQKVRVVLAHHALAYLGHELNMFAGQTYLPGYVRLRMLGCAAYGGALVARHSGSTSAAAGGCDGAVVPTLIDWDGEAVIVDSKRICLYLDDAQPKGVRLRPAALASAIDADLETIDNLPNYQMLMGRPVSDTESATSRGNTGASFSRRKVAWCSRYLDEHRDDPVLAAAYTAKMAKEGSAAEALFSPEAMQAAYDRAEGALVALDARLGSMASRWLHGEAVTMADLFWGIELLRMENTGVARFWQDGLLPHVAKYFGGANEIPAIRAAVVDWPGATF